MRSEGATVRRRDEATAEDDLSFSAVLRGGAEDATARKTARTRMRLLAAMAETLAEGVDRRELKVASVTAAAGLSHGAFYRYFEDMRIAVEALIEAFAGFVHDRLAGARQGAGGSRERVRHATLVYTRLFRANPALMRCLFSLGAENAVFARTYRKLNAAWYARMAAAIARGRAGQGAGEDASIAAMLPVAYALGGMVDEFLTGLYLRRDPALAALAENEKAVADLLTDLWRRAAYGNPPETNAD